MATEPEMPDLKGLRHAYAKAIAASISAEDALAVARDAGASAGSLENARLARNLAHDDELEAGRAFMALLQEEDPACVRCGCTTYDPCVHESGETCGWASREPAICSFCARTEEWTS